MTVKILTVENNIESKNFIENNTPKSNSQISNIDKQSDKLIPEIKSEKSDTISRLSEVEINYNLDCEHTLQNLNEFIQYYIKRN